MMCAPRIRGVLARVHSTQTLERMTSERHC